MEKRRERPVTLTTATDEERAHGVSVSAASWPRRRRRHAREAGETARRARLRHPCRVSALILDTSAIVAFAGGSVDVGEPMAEVRDADGVVIVPVVCLVEASRTVDDGMLRVLVDNPVCELIPFTGDRWPMATTTTRTLGRLDRLFALIAASDVDGFVLTAEPDAYGTLGEDVVIPLN